MKTRIKRIITELYTSPKSKDEFMSLLNVSQKTVENTITAYNAEGEEIVYDRKLGKYRFDVLLPREIPHFILFKYLQDNISNVILNDDFKEVVDILKISDELDIPMIPTYRLSPLLKNIIMIQQSFILNAVLKIQYLGLKQKLETKYIRPHTLINTGYTYYLFASYDEENGIKVGENRSFALKGIKEIDVYKRVQEALYKDVKGNAWGPYNKDQYIILHAKGNAAGFFKREKITDNGSFEFISEEEDGSINFKMFYNQIDEIIQLMQKWMPYISILKKSLLSDSIYEKIKNNFVDLTIRREQY